MRFDQIWKQQLTLVTFGNAYLSQNLSFSRWVNHSIFQQHQLQFRDLQRQHLLAQHFQIWLQGLKQQGVTRLSLHRSDLLMDEKNPNPNVELLPYAHFIVSHSPKQKLAWICGKELATWDVSEQEFIAPPAQQIKIRHETLWCYELNKHLAKRIQADLAPAQWDDIQQFLQQELFTQPVLADFVEAAELNEPYTGMHVDTEHPLALFPTDTPSEFAHQSLHRFDAIKDFIAHKIQHPYAADGTVFSPEQQQHMRLLQQKVDDLHSKFIVKVANHYQTAQVTPLPPPTAFNDMVTPIKPELQQVKTGNANVFKLIVVTVVICALAYYFGL